MTALAVLDIGKTNVKLVAFSDTGSLLAERRTTQKVVQRDGLKTLDVDALEQWLRPNLAELQAAHAITGLMISTHGCCFALVGKQGLLAPIIDYEQELDAQTRAAFDAISPPFSETFSPRLPAGLNFASHIYLREQQDPALFSQATAILTYPQYWGWRLSGTRASEVSYLGCHSHLWAPLQYGFSSLTTGRAWAKKFPPLVRAGAVIGQHGELAIHNGVHDSNAVLYFYRSLGFKNFTLLSTGTWVIGFNPALALERLDQTRDMLANVSVDHQPVATARFMGGREYDVISESSRIHVTREMIEHVIARRQMALPSFAEGGPFPGRKGHWHGPAATGEAERAAVATLYIAMMMNEMLAMLGSENDVIIDGGLVHNEALLAILATLRSAQAFYSNADAEGTAMGAAALAFEALGKTGVFSPKLTPVTAWPVTGLEVYAREWREAVA